MDNKRKWGKGPEGIVEIETRRRIQLAVYAFAYEIKAESLVSDEVYDKEALLVDLSITTNRPDLDEWFKEYFGSHTGNWIHSHPELRKIAQLYETYYTQRPTA